MSTRPERFIVTMLAALAMTVFVSARAAFSQDADDYGTGAVSGASVDPSWDSGGPAIDESAESAEKVLEIPQATCADGSSGPCDADADADSNTATDNDGQAINAPSPGAPPPTVVDETASSAPSTDDWGTAADYQNQQVYAVPYAVYPYSVAATTGALNRPQVPASAYMPMSGPLTQAAQPPLNPGPWMNSASMSAFSRPAGSPMAGMMSSPAWGFHH
jgi:hypothetical protein